MRGNVPDRGLMLTEMEDEPIDDTPGEPGILSPAAASASTTRQRRRPMTGYATTIYENGAVYSRFQAKRRRRDHGRIEDYNGIGKLSSLKGAGAFVVNPRTSTVISWIWKEPTNYRE